MANGPKQKYFGSLSLDGLGEAVRTIPSKVNTHEKYGKQIKVTAAMWEDGGISIEVWDPENKKSIKLGNLRISTLDGAKPVSAPTSSETESDLPF